MDDTELQQYLDSLRTGVPVNAGIMTPRVPLGVQVQPVAPASPQPMATPLPTGTDLTTARLQQALAQQGWMSGQHNLDSPVIPTVPTAPITTADLISRIAAGPGTAVPTPGVSFQDPKDTSPVPLPTPVDPLARFRTALTQGGGGGSRQLDNTGVSTGVDAIKADIEANKLEGQRLLDAANKAHGDYVTKGQGMYAALPKYETYDREGKWKALDASTPMPTVAQPAGLGGFLSRLVGSIDAHGRWSPTNMTAYDTHLKDTTQAEMDKKLALRNADLLLKMGFSEKTVADINASQKLESERALGSLALENPDKEKWLTQMGLGNNATALKAGVSADKLKMDQDLKIAQINARAMAANSPGAQQQAQLGAINQAVVSGQITPDEGQRAKLNVLHDPGVKEPKPITPLHGDHIKLIDDTAQSLIGPKMNTPQGKELYAKFRMALSNPATQDQALPALYTDIRNFK